METIIGLLFVLLPVIFNLIGKKLEKSGKTSGAGKMREIAKALGADEDELISEWPGNQDEETDGAEIAVHDSVVMQPEPVPAEPRQVEVVPQVLKTEVKPVARHIVPKSVQPVLKAEPDERKEKIDPKKLVVYSEIMKPKFTE